MTRTFRWLFWRSTAQGERWIKTQTQSRQIFSTLLSRASKNQHSSQFSEWIQHWSRNLSSRVDNIVTLRHSTISFAYQPVSTIGEFSVKKKRKQILSCDICGSIMSMWINCCSFRRASRNFKSMIDCLVFGASALGVSADICQRNLKCMEDSFRQSPEHPDITFSFPFTSVLRVPQRVSVCVTVAWLVTTPRYWSFGWKGNKNEAEQVWVRVRVRSRFQHHSLRYAIRIQMSLHREKCLWHRNSISSCKL